MTQTPDLPPGKSPEPNPYSIGMRDDGRGSDRRPKRFSTVEFGMLLVAVLAALKLLLDAVMSALDMILAAQFFWVLIIATSGPFIIQALRVWKGCPEPRHPVVDALRSVVDCRRFRNR